MNKDFQLLRQWFANALEFTLGNPSAIKNNPPEIGIQPYRDKPLRAH